MKNGSTLFLKITIFLMGLPVILLGIYGLYSLVKNPPTPEYAHILYPVAAGIYVCAIPYFCTLRQAFLLLRYIDKNEAFSALSVKALRKIKYFAAIISGICVMIWPFIVLAAQKEEAPGLVIIGAAPAFASLTIAVFAAVLQRLLQEAINIKIENELTV